MGLCNDGDFTDLRASLDFGWVFVVKLELPQLDPDPCMSAYDKVRKYFKTPKTSYAWRCIHVTYSHHNKIAQCENSCCRQATSFLQRPQRKAFQMRISSHFKVVASGCSFHRTFSIVWVETTCVFVAWINCTTVQCPSAVDLFLWKVQS